VASLATATTLPVSAGLFGLPSLHSIIQAIAGGFFGALAEALVPSWLRHGTVATIQHLVALPDPGSWSHVRALQGEMTYLAMMLLPVTLAVGATRYWLVGLTGSAHPASSVVRAATSTGVLVAYRWLVEQTVAAANTLSHGILGLPVVSAGLGRIIGVLFGGALLAGGGGVFGAFLVIVGVVFAAGLFAAQVLLTVALALLVVTGPPLIALSAIPELSHLARGWADALLAVALVPIGWTILFATAGALCLDATSFTGAGGSLPAHVAAAFAGLITFVLAVRLPFIAAGELRNILTRHNARAATASSAPPPPPPGAERVRSAHARLRAVGLQAVPSLGASVGRAAGALGAPPGGPLGAAKRRVGAAAQRAFRRPAGMPPVREAARQPTPGKGESPPTRRGVRQRLAAARAVLAAAPGEAIAAMNTGSRRTTTVRRHAPGMARGAQQRPPGTAGNKSDRPRRRADSAAGTRPPAARAPAVPDPQRGTRRWQAAPTSPGRANRPAAPERRANAGQETRAPQGSREPHPAGKLTASTRRREPQAPARQQGKAPQASPTRTSAPKTPSTPPVASSKASRSPRQGKRKPRPRSQP